MLFASQLIIGVPGTWTTSIDDIRVTDALGLRRSLRHWRILDHLSPATEDQSSAPHTLIVLPLSGLAGLDLSARLKISLKSSEGVEMDLFARPEALRTGEDADPRCHGFVAAVVGSGGVDAHAAALFKPNVRRMEVGAREPLRLLRAHRTENAVVVEGMIENLVLRDLALATRDLTVLVPLEDMIVRASDEPLACGGASEVMEDHSVGEDRLSLGGTRVQHFTAVFSRALQPVDEIVLLEVCNDELLIFEPVAVPTERLSATALATFVDNLGAEAAIDPKRVVASLGPLLSIPTSARPATPHRFGPRHGQPKISVIVPLSGSELFLRSILAQHSKFPQALEWIFCAEHMPSSATLLPLLSSLSTRLVRSTTLILSSSLCGPVRLRNLGFEAAEGDVIAFLDEGSWIEDPKTWLVAFREIRERRFDLVGVGGHFSDGTLDNEGLVRSRARGNPLLQRVDFRRRGFPSSGREARVSVEPVEAVSSASMLVSRACLSTAGGFDDSFALTDFADLDLSLRAAQAGAVVGFVRGNGTVRGRSGTELGRLTTRDKAYMLLEGARLALHYPIDVTNVEKSG